MPLLRTTNRHRIICITDYRVPNDPQYDDYEPHFIIEDSIYAVQLDEADVTLKRLRRVEDTVWMISSNPRIPPMPLDGERYAQARLLGTVAKLERYY